MVAGSTAGTLANRCFLTVAEGMAPGINASWHRVSQPGEVLRNM